MTFLKHRGLGDLFVKQLSEPRELLRVCFVAPNAYPAVNPLAGSSIGGLETGAWRLVSGLANEKDFCASLVVHHNRPILPTNVNGVELIPIIERFRDIRLAVSRRIAVDREFPWIKFERFYWKLLWQVPLLVATRGFRDRRPLPVRIAEQIKSLVPDVCVAVGNGATSAAVVRAAREMGKVSVLWLQSNSDLEARFFSDDNYQNPYGERASDCRYSLENSSVILSQSRWQQAAVKRLVRRDSILLPTPIPFEQWGTDTERSARGQHVLWIGRFDRFHKRPQLCLEIAKRCPEICFAMVINRGDPDVEEQIRREATANIRIIDYMPPNRMPTLFRESRLFVSTGSADYEGFPNVLLEAAATGTPVITMEDFDKFVEKSGCGRHSIRDLDRIAESVRELWGDEVQWRELSHRGQKWVREHHSIRDAVSRFRRAVENI